MADKKIRVMIATNIYKIDPCVYASHLNLFYRVGRDLNVDIMFSGPYRYAIDNARNFAASQALLGLCDYLFFYDDDMYIFDPNVLKVMLKKMMKRDDVHIMQAVAYIRGYPYDTMFFKLDKDNDKQLEIYNDWKGHEDKDGLVRGDAVGCCATLIDCKLFKMMPQPWFQTGQKNTEDIYFCMKARDYIANVGVFLDTTVEVGHTLDRPILCSANREILKEIHEKYGLNQMFLPEPNFAKNIMLTKEPLAKKEMENPLLEGVKK